MEEGRYVVERLFFGDVVESLTTPNWSDVMEALPELQKKVKKYGRLFVYNADGHDFCTIEGYDDGLTEEQREDIEPFM